MLNSHILNDHLCSLKLLLVLTLFIQEFSSVFLFKNIFIVHTWKTQCSSSVSGQWSEFQSVFVSAHLYRRRANPGGRPLLIYCTGVARKRLLGQWFTTSRLFCSYLVHAPTDKYISFTYWYNILKDVCNGFQTLNSWYVKNGSPRW